MSAGGLRQAALGAAGCSHGGSLCGCTGFGPSLRPGLGVPWAARAAGLRVGKCEWEGKRGENPVLTAAGLKGSAGELPEALSASSGHGLHSRA